MCGTWKGFFFCIHIAGVRGIIGLDWAMSYGRVDTPYFIGIDAIAILVSTNPLSLHCWCRWRIGEWRAVACYGERRPASPRVSLNDITITLDEKC